MGITKVVTEANLSKPILCKLSSPYQSLVGGAITILKNDGVRQREGWHPIYEMENTIHVPNHQSEFLVCSNTALEKKNMYSW